MTSILPVNGRNTITGAMQSSIPSSPAPTEILRKHFRNGAMRSDRSFAGGKDLIWYPAPFKKF